jgi:hypothetical protein
METTSLIQAIDILKHCSAEATAVGGRASLTRAILYLMKDLLVIE